MYKLITAFRANKCPATANAVIMYAKGNEQVMKVFALEIQEAIDYYKSLQQAKPNAA